MRPRIEIVEVVSFRLSVAQDSVEQLVVELASELQLALEREGEDLVLLQRDADCSLRFLVSGDELELSEILICNDEGGAFFYRVVGRLMTEHQGDLDVKLQWNTPERNTLGSFAPIAYRRGRPVQPRVSAARALRNTLAASADPLGELAQVASAGGPAPDEDEIAQLLERARAAWAEYQKLKSSRG